MTTYNNFRIFNENYIDSDLLANYDASSANASFPVTNAFNQNRRSKVWRSEGYFNVTSSNNVIIFRESTGVDLTATITVAEYTSVANFMTAIKTALDAAGVSTYTVAQDVLRIKITSNGVGGDGIFQLMTSDGSFTAEDMIGFDTTDKTGALFYTADYIRINTSEFIIFDMGIATDPSSFMMIDQRNASLQLSPSGTFKLEANETNDFSTPSFSQTLTYDEEVISYLQDSEIAGTAYRYWRILFDDISNPNGYIQIGAFFLGNYWNPQRGKANFPLTQGYVDRSPTIFSEGGQTYSDIKQKTQTFSLSFRALQKADIETFDTIFEDFGTSKPFFVSMDTAEVFSSDLNRMLIFCKFERAPQYTLVSPDNFEMSLSLREEL